MAISPDVLATALQDLAPGYSELFSSWSPVLDRVVKKGNIERNVLQGPYKEFVVVTDGPGNVTQIVTGSEIIGGGRRQNAKRGNSYAPRLIYAIDVPAKDLSEANGEMDLARIIENYPELGMLDLNVRLQQQFVLGNGTDVGGFITLNGDQTFTPQGTALTGIMSYAAKASQTSTVEGLVKQGGASGVSGWYNQYANITSFSTNGLSQMRKAYYAANRQGAQVKGTIDLVLADEGSYLNYLDNLTDVVRITDRSEVAKGDYAPSEVREGVKFENASMFIEEKLDITSSAITTAAAQNGLMYFLNTATWHIYTLGHDSSKETKGFFDIRGPFRIPEQDMFRYEIVLSMGMYTNQLRMNAAVTGGNNP